MGDSKSNDGPFTYSLLKNVIEQGYKLERKRDISDKSSIILSIEKMEAIILKVEDKMKDIYSEVNVDKIDAINPFLLNNSVNMEDIIVDHRTAISF